MKIHKYKNVGWIAPLTLLALPAVAHAQPAALTNVLTDVGNVIQSLFPILAGLAMLAFFWGLAQYVLAAGDEEGRDKGKKIMVAGIVALFLIAAITGIVTWLVDAFGFGSEEIDPGGEGIEGLGNTTGS